ncbi:hypothetical protein ACP4OV_017731 [Aristida adscensionis]
MVRRVFVFSDMEFDEALEQPWETNHDAIVRKFTEAGYGAALPAGGGVLQGHAGGGRAAGCGARQ